MPMIVQILKFVKSKQSLSDLYTFDDFFMCLFVCNRGNTILCHGGLHTNDVKISAIKGVRPVPLGRSPILFFLVVKRLLFQSFLLILYFFAFPGVHEQNRLHQ